MPITLERGLEAWKEEGIRILICAPVIDQYGLVYLARPAGPIDTARAHASTQGGRQFNQWVRRQRSITNSFYLFNHLLFVVAALARAVWAGTWSAPCHLLGFAALLSTGVAALWLRRVPGFVQVRKAQGIWVLLPCAANKCCTALAR